MQHVLGVVLIKAYISYKWLAEKGYGLVTTGNGICDCPPMDLPVIPAQAGIQILARSAMPDDNRQRRTILLVIAFAGYGKGGTTSTKGEMDSPGRANRFMVPDSWSFNGG